MSKRLSVGCLLFGLLAIPSYLLAQGDIKKPTWLAGLEFRVRKADEADFSPMTKRYGLEIFKDENAGNYLYVTETGAVTLAPALALPSEAKVKQPTWLYGMKFAVRKATEADFTKDTRRYGVEVFKDENTGNLIYVSDTGDVTEAPAGNIAPEVKTRTPTWYYGQVVPVRKAGEADFTKDTKRIGIEVFKDENTGYLLYVSDTGAMAQGPAAAKPADGKAKAAAFLHAMELRVRKAGEIDFTKDTKKFGVEVYRDENTGVLLYVCESGAIAVVPAKPAAPDGKAKAPTWLHAMELGVRKAGEAEFGAATKKWGVEVFRDENNGNLVYISETGSLALAPTK